MFMVGTSGWQYRDWRGVFYPAGLPDREKLTFYAQRFAVVENNSTFYRLPARETFVGWAERTPRDFVMAVKASRYLTHVRRLRDPAQPVGRLLDAAAGLGGKLGPVLLQLPPNLQVDVDGLAACLAEFRARGPAGMRIAVEPRHDSWWTAAVEEVLARHDAALVWGDRRERVVGPLWRTSDWGYVRLHEGTGTPAPRYRERVLGEWVDRIAARVASDCQVYFNNDQGAAAVHDAAAFADAARAAGHAVTRTWRES